MKKLLTLSLLLLSTSSIFGAATLQKLAAHTSIFAKTLRTSAACYGKKTAKPNQLVVSLKGTRKALRNDIEGELSKAGAKLKKAEFNLEKKLKETEKDMEARLIELISKECTRISGIIEVTTEHAINNIEAAAKKAVQDFEIAAKKHQGN